MEEIKLYVLDQLFNFINEIETSSSVKKSLKAMVVYDFYENDQYNDEYNPVPYFKFIENITNPPSQTTGIVYHSQLVRFIKVFVDKMWAIQFRNIEPLLIKFNYLHIPVNIPFSISISQFTAKHGFSEIENEAPEIYKNYAVDMFQFYERFEDDTGSDLRVSKLFNLPLFNHIFFHNITKYIKGNFDINTTSFLASWFTQSTSLLNWQKYTKIDISGFFKSFNIEPQLLENIRAYQKKLFTVHVDSVFCSYVDKFVDIKSNEDKIEAADTSISIISKLVSGAYNDVSTLTLKELFNIVDPIITYQQLQNITRGKFPSVECYDIHNKDSYANATAILKYRTYLEKFLNSPKSKPMLSQFNPIIQSINDLFLNLENLEYIEDKETFDIWYMYQYGNIYNTEEGPGYDEDERYFIFDRKKNKDYHGPEEFGYEFEIDIDEFIKNQLRPLLLDCDDSLKVNIKNELNNIIEDLRIKQSDLNQLLANDTIDNSQKNIQLPIIEIKLNNIQKIVDYTKSYIKDIPQNTIHSKSSHNKNKIPKYIAFEYTQYANHLSNITDMHKTLMYNNYIDKSTDLVEFRKIFNNTLPTSPIIWIDGISSLYYFIKNLHSSKVIKKDSDSNKWVITSNLFIDQKGAKFNSANLKGSKTPANTDLLDKAINHLK